MTPSITDLLDSLKELMGKHVLAADYHRVQAEIYAREVAILEARIKGIEDAIGFYEQLQSSNGDEPQPQRRKRRDIKALVRERVTDDDLRNSSYAGENEIAQLIGVSPHYVRAIVKTLRKEVAPPTVRSAIISDIVYTPPEKAK